MNTEKKSNPRFIITDEEIRQGAKKFNRRLDFFHGANSLYLAARRRGILDDVCCHMGGSKYHRWTKEEARELALQCKDWKDFRDKYPMAYGASCRNKWLPYVCKDVPRIYKSYY